MILIQIMTYWIVNSILGIKLSLVMVRILFADYDHLSTC